MDRLKSHVFFGCLYPGFVPAALILGCTTFIGPIVMMQHLVSCDEISCDLLLLPECSLDCRHVEGGEAALQENLMKRANYNVIKSQIIMSLKASR